MQFTEQSSRSPCAAPLLRVHGFWRSLVLAFALVLLSAFGALKTLDYGLYDYLVRHSSNAAPPTREVLLVDAPVFSFSDPAIRWLDITNKLIALGAAQVVFTSAPDASRETVEELVAAPHVVVGAGLASDPEQHGALRFDLPRELAMIVPRAASVIPDPLHGAHREQKYAYRIGGKDVPSLEALVFSRLGGAVPGEGRYFIDFTGGPKVFPRISLSQLARGDVIESLVRGRVVLIGPSSDRFDHSIVTPATTTERAVSKLEYHGFALDTLLRGSQVVSLPPYADELLMAAIWLACVLLLQSMPFRKAVLAASCMVVALVAVSWALLFQHIDLPVLGSILVIGSSVVSIFHSKTEYQNQALMRLVTAANLAAAGRLAGKTVPMHDAFWSHVLAMVDQMLPITRAVLLERVEDAKHLREVQSVRCTFATVGERRRDLSRAPYSTAVEKRRTVDARGFLADAEPGELQFLVPLIWDGRVLGFLAVGVHPNQAINRPAFVRSLDLLGKRLSELMQERSQSATQSDGRFNLRDFLVDERDLAIRKLTQQLSVIERHISVFEDVFDGLEAPAIVYDLFGRPLVSNSRMSSVLNAARLKAETQSAADLLEAVGDLNPDVARTVLNGVVFEGDIFEQIVRVADTSYLLHVSRLNDSAARLGTGTDVLQHIHGLLIQLFPVPKLEVRETFKPSQRLWQSSGPYPDRAGTLVQEDETDVDVLHAVNAAIASMVSTSGKDAVNVAVTASQEKTRALAHPKKFKDILAALIRFLAEDAKQSGKLSVTLAAQGDQLVLNLQNNGFGMPDEKLQSMLEGESDPQSDCLRRIRQLRDSAFGRHGRLAMRSSVGTGYVAMVTMRKAG